MTSALDAPPEMPESSANEEKSSTEYFMTNRIWAKAQQMDFRCALAHIHLCVKAPMLATHPRILIYKILFLVYNTIIGSVVDSCGKFSCLQEKLFAKIYKGSKADKSKRKRKEDKK